MYWELEATLGSDAIHEFIGSQKIQSIDVSRSLVASLLLTSNLVDSGIVRACNLALSILEGLRAEKSPTPRRFVPPPCCQWLCPDRACGRKGHRSAGWSPSRRHGNNHQRGDGSLVGGRHQRRRLLPLPRSRPQ